MTKPEKLSPKAWAYQFAAQALDDALYCWVPAGTTRAQVRAGYRLLKKLKMEALALRNGGST